MRLAVDARFLERDRRGMGRYVTCTLAAMRELAPNLEIVLLTDRPSAAGARADVCWCPWNRADLTIPDAPCVVTIHDLAPFVCPPQGWWRGGDRRRDIRRLEDAAARADVVVTCSNFIRQEVLTHLGVDQARVVVVPEGVETSFSAAEDAPRDGGVLWVGTDEPRKNLGCLIDALGRVRARGCDVRLTVCGDNPDLTVRHGARIAEAGVGGCVDMMGYLADEALAREYRRARVFVCPSTYEGFGLPVLEAMASGAPVVCSTAAALPETAGDAARYFDPDDPAALADEIFGCLNDPRLTADLSARGRARAQQFSWADTAARLLTAMDLTCRTSA